MSSIKEIILLFSELTPEEQTKCLNSLKFQAGESEKITTFSQRHQAVYKENIRFIKTPQRKGITLIEITLITSFGKFIGHGNTNEQAKLNAIIEAEEQQFESLVNDDTFSYK